MRADVAMWRALQHRDISRLKRSLARGADPTRADAAGRCALHEAANSDDSRLLDCLLSAVPPSRRQAAVNLTDVWGETPLHRAVVSDRRIASAQMLLNAGALINAPGALGRRPLLMAATMQAVRTARMLRRRGASDDLGEMHEAGRRAFLGELFGLRGHTPLGNTKVPLHHGIAEAVFEPLSALLQQVAADPHLPCRMDGRPASHARTFAKTVTHIAETFAQAGHHIGTDPSSLLAAIRAGNTVVLPSGTQRHAVIFVWHRGVLVSCERGRLWWAPWAKRTCRVVSTSAASLTRDDVLALQRSGVLQDRQDCLRIARLHRRGDHADHTYWQHVCTGHRFKAQHVNNCVTAGAKMAIYALISLLHPEIDEEERAQWYKRVTTRLRVLALKSYAVEPGLGRNVSADAQLIVRCKEKLVERDAKSARNQ